MKEAGAEGSRRFYPELESLRGLAALSVAGFHVSQALVPTGAGPIKLRDMPSGAMDVLNFFFLGAPPVIFFFTLSGFVLTASLRNAGRPVSEIAVPFVITRLFRIYPAWIFTILVFASVYWLSGRTLGIIPDTAEIIRNLALLSVTMDGVGWSIQTELLAVPVLLLAFHWLCAGKMRAIVVIAALLAVFINLLKPILYLPGGPSRVIYLYCFLFGAVTCVLLPRADPRKANLIFCCGVAAFFLGAYLFANHSNVKDAWCTIASCIVITGAALGLTGWLAIFRDSTLLRFMGRISYSFYLLHPLTLTIFWQMPQVLETVLRAGYPPWFVVLAMFLISAVITLPLAALSYRFVERPFVRIGSRLTSSMRPRADVSAVPAGMS